VRTDELELAWDDETERGRHRHRRRRRGGDGGGGRGGRSAIAFVLALVVLAVLGGGIWYGFTKLNAFFATPDYNSGGHGAVTVEIKRNQTAADIGLELEKQDVVKSQKAFVEAAKDNPRSREIQPGFYNLRKQMRAADALGLLLDRANRVVSKVTLQEGLTYKVTLQKLAEATKIPMADFEAAAKDPIALGIPAFWFNRFDQKESIKSVEGFLWPDTYEFNPGVTAEQVLKQMIAQFMKTAESLNLVKVAESKNISPFAALITASLVQAESGVPTDDGKVARVVYNRLDKKMALEFDSTTNYWRELQGQERKFNLNDEELLDPSNPYRTYGQLGLPPGPIGNPGKAALEASINPTPGNFLYFVRIDKAGNSAFTDSFSQHERNIEEAKRNGAY
jgi:UPF0755 protein